MLLIKCPQCQASYRLAESLYRRKAAGYGVVITCRRCKTQIHLDEGAIPTAAGEADKTVAEAGEADISASPAPTAVTPAARTPIATKADDIPTNPAGFPKPDPSDPDDDTTGAAVDALPNVAPKPAPRPGGIPRPGAGATQPRRGATLLGIPPPANPPAALVPTRQPPRKDPAGDGWKPKLVALSPGLLGVETATKGAPPGAKAPPGPPHPTRAEPPPVEQEPGDESPDSAVPLSAGSIELLDSSVDMPPPDSAVPLDSADYLSAPKAAPPAPPHAKAEPAEAKGKRMPQPPPTPHLPKVVARETNSAELPSETSAPKVSELALGSSPLPLSQKKGEPQGRKRQQSGDLTDDFLTADVGFEAAPALAPPDPSALTRAPVSSRRPAAAGSSTATGTSTKAPVSKTSPSEKKGSGRGVAFLLVAAAFGGVGYVLQHRASTPEAPKPEPQAAVNVAPPEPPVAPLETATPPAEPAPADSAAAPAESAAPPEPSATAPAVAATPPGHATATTAAPAATAKTPKSTAETPAAPTEKVATTATTKPAPTSATPTVIEPRGAAGTEPFDVASARSALDATAAQASGCRKEGDPSGVAIVTITFSQTGRVTTANISGPPFQATPTGGCIASTMRKTRVPAFAGDMVTVRKTVTIQ